MEKQVGPHFIKGKGNVVYYWYHTGSSNGVDMVMSDGFHDISHMMIMDEKYNQLVW